MMLARSDRQSVQWPSRNSDVGDVVIEAAAAAAAAAAASVRLRKTAKLLHPAGAEDPSIVIGCAGLAGVRLARVYVRPCVHVSCVLISVGGSCMSGRQK